MTRTKERLQDILEAVENIRRYAARGRNAFERDELVQVWTLHHLRIIGEAVRVVKPEVRAAHPDIPWASIVGMRNILVHHYFDIDPDLVWGVIERDLDPLERAVTAMLAQEDDDETSL